MSGLSQEARALIEDVSDLDGPSAADKARIQKRLVLELGAAAFAASMVPMATGGVGSAGPSATLAPTGAWLGSLGKAALALGALGGVTAALLLGGPETQRSVATSKPVVPADTARALDPAQPPLSQNAAPLAVTGDATHAAPAPSTAAAAMRARPTASAARHTNPVAPTADSTTANTLSQELALLGRAQAALRTGDAKQTLALAQEHARLFPEGVMKQERMGVAALAECALPGHDRTHANAFLQLAPQSPLAARVRKACGLE